MRFLLMEINKTYVTVRVKQESPKGGGISDIIVSVLLKDQLACVVEHYGGSEGKYSKNK